MIQRCLSFLVVLIVSLVDLSSSASYLGQISPLDAIDWMNINGAEHHGSDLVPRMFYPTDPSGVSFPGPTVNDVATPWLDPTGHST